MTGWFKVVLPWWSFAGKSASIGVSRIRSSNKWKNLDLNETSDNITTTSFDVQNFRLILNPIQLKSEWNRWIIMKGKDEEAEPIFSLRYGFNDIKRLSDKFEFICTLKSTLRQLSYHRHMRKWNEGRKLQRGKTPRFYLLYPSDRNERNLELVRYETFSEWTFVWIT